MSLADAILFRAQLLRDMAADDLRAHRKFRGSVTPACRELADWYEGRYQAYKRAAEMITNTLEMHA